jgi:hypothetical protein
MSDYHNPAEERRRAVRGLLSRLGGYGALNVAIISRHLDTHGSLLTCENVRTSDRTAVNALVARHNERNEPAPLAADWQDGWRWVIGPEPTELDRDFNSDATMARQAVAR